MRKAGVCGPKTAKRFKLEKKFLKKYCRGIGVDVGCGQTKISPYAIGIDIFPFKPVNILASGNKLDMFADKSLDYIVSSHVLEHFLDTKKVLNEWNRILKKGGIIGIISPDGNLLPESIFLDGHKVLITKQNLMRIFKKMNYKKIILRNLSELKNEISKKSILCIYKKL